MERHFTLNVLKEAPGLRELSDFDEDIQEIVKGSQHFGQTVKHLAEAIMVCSQWRAQCTGADDAMKPNGHGTNYSQRLLWSLPLGTFLS